MPIDRATHHHPSTDGISASPGRAHDIAALLRQMRERHGRFGNPLPLPADEPIPATAIILEDREPWQCVWPVNHGEPRYLYCGARKAIEETRFCDAHAAKAYRGRLTN